MSDYKDALDRRLERVVELTREGRSATEIGVLLGITERSVQRYRRRAGIAQTVNPPLSAEEILLAERLFDDGCSYAEVARTLGRCPDPLRRRFPGRGWTKEQSDEFVAVLRRCRVRMSKHEGMFIK